MKSAQVSRAVADELASLSPEQREAATYDGDLVVLAGPGSGKTRTIVARTAFLLATRADHFCGIACITYTNAAAREIRQRLARIGLLPGRMLASSTVHAFCLQHILRPYSVLAGRSPLGPGAVLDKDDILAVWQEIFDALGITDDPQYQDALLTRIRRALASSEPTDGYDDRYVDAARSYEEYLESTHVIDFEGMVSQALRILRSSPIARELLVARFPHVVVDEYQDLGSVLHDLILELRNAGVTVTAVGDFDQTIFEFTGSDPKYLLSLSREHGFHKVALRTNFRSGSAIIDASKHVLGQDRDHHSVEGAPQGEVVLKHVEGAYRDHAAAVVDEILAATAVGVPRHEIAVLYPRVGALLTAIRRAVEAAGIDVLFEKDNRLPPGPVSRLIQLCATRLLAFSSDRSEARPEGAPAQKALLEALIELRNDAGLPTSDLFALRREVYGLTDGHLDVDPADSAEAWLEELQRGLGLAEVSRKHPERSSERAFDYYRQHGGELLLRDLAAQEYVPGKVVLTNYHSAKGREFDVVILPGLVDREVPKYDWDYPNFRWVLPSARQLAAYRREFYVAMTRARDRLVLITGNRYVDKHGKVITTRTSRFLDDLRRKGE